MSVKRYSIEGKGDKWLIRGDLETGVAYVTREAAFEAAVADASIQLKTGEGIEIRVAPWLGWPE